MPKYNITIEKRQNPVDSKLGDVMTVCGVSYFAMAPVVPNYKLWPNEVRLESAIRFAAYWARAVKEFQKVCDKDPCGDTVPDEVYPE